MAAIKRCDFLYEAARLITELRPRAVHAGHRGYAEQRCGLHDAQGLSTLTDSFGMHAPAAGIPD
jgi:hypothetical protein